MLENLRTSLEEALPASNVFELEECRADFVDEAQHLSDETAAFERFMERGMEEDVLNTVETLKAFLAQYRLRSAAFLQRVFEESSDEYEAVGIQLTAFELLLHDRLASLIRQRMLGHKVRRLRSALAPVLAQHITSVYEIDCEMYRISSDLFSLIFAIDRADLDALESGNINVEVLHTILRLLDCSLDMLESDEDLSISFRALLQETLTYSFVCDFTESEEDPDYHYKRITRINSILKEIQQDSEQRHALCNRFYAFCESQCDKKTQDAVAKRIRVSRPTLSSIMSGNGHLTRRFILNAMEYCDLTMDDLFFDDDSDEVRVLSSLLFEDTLGIDVDSEHLDRFTAFLENLTDDEHRALSLVVTQFCADQWNSMSSAAASLAIPPNELLSMQQGEAPVSAYLLGLISAVRPSFYDQFDEASVLSACIDHPSFAGVTLQEVWKRFASAPPEFGSFFLSQCELEQSLSDVSRITGVNLPFLASVKTGRANMTANIFCCLCMRLGLTASAVFNDFENIADPDEESLLPGLPRDVLIDVLRVINRVQACKVCVGTFIYNAFSQASYSLEETAAALKIPFAANVRRLRTGKRNITEDMLAQCQDHLAISPVVILGECFTYDGTHIRFTLPGELSLAQYDEILTILQGVPSLKKRFLAYFWKQVDGFYSGSAALAPIFNCEPQRVTAYRLGKQPISSVILDRMSKDLEVPMDRLLHGDGVRITANDESVTLSVRRESEPQETYAGFEYADFKKHLRTIQEDPDERSSVIERFSILCLYGGCTTFAQVERRLSVTKGYLRMIRSQQIAISADLAILAAREFSFSVDSLVKSDESFFGVPIENIASIICHARSGAILIASLRGRYKNSLSKAASAIGCNAQSLSNIEHGQAISLVMMIRICRGTGLKIPELLPGIS